MTKIMRKGYVLLLVMMLGITLIPQQVVFALQSDTLKLTSEVSYEEDSQKAIIKLTPEFDQSKYEIKEILNPEGESMDMSNLTYEALVNDEYTFTMNYIEKSIIPESTPEVKVVIETVNVDDIKVIKEVQKSPIGKSNASLTTKIINADGSEWDGNTWGNGIQKTVEVIADFADTTSDGKKIEFILPDGMTYVSIPVPSDYKLESGVDNKKITQFSAADPLNKAITQINVAKKETGYHKETFGKTTYEFDRSTEKVKLSFIVQVDDWKYYGAHTLKDKMVMDAFKNGSSIGKEEKTIHADGKVTRSWGEQDSLQTAYRQYSSIPSDKLILSTPDETIRGYGPMIYAIGPGSVSVNESSMFPKKVTVTQYFPKEMKFEGLYVGIGANEHNYAENSGFEVDIYQEEGKVVYSYSPAKQIGIYALRVGYSAPVGTELKKYTESRVPKAEFITYDDTTYTVDALSRNLTDMTTKAPPYSFEVVDSLGTKMKVLTENFYFDEGEVGPTAHLGFTNELGRRQNDVMYHVIADPNLEAYDVLIYNDSSIKGNKITDIQYKTNLNPNYRNYTGDLSKTGNDQWFLKKEVVGLQEGEYFTDVLANIGSVSPGFRYPPGRYANQALIYGKVKEGNTQISSTLELWIKDKKESTITSGTSTSKKTSTTDSSASNSTFDFLNSKSSIITNGTATAGDTITVSGQVKMGYPYGYVKVIRNPEIYLRQVDMTSIDRNSIKLTDLNNKEVPYDLEERKLKTGETVVVLKTKNTKVSDKTDYPPKKHSINVTYDLKISTKLTYNLTLNTNTMIAWGNQDISSAGAGSNAYRSFNDVGFDMDGDGKDNEYLLGIYDATLSIPKSDKVIVNTFLSIPGEEPKEYIEGDDKTLSYFTPGTASEYIFRIENLSTQPSSSFELYAPIPKEGQNFGINYQKDDFKWNMKMTGTPVISNIDKFDIYYATNATKDTIQEDVGYTSTVSDLAAVNAVKFVMKEALAPGESIEVRIPLAIDETHQSATDKIKTRNIFNPRFKMVTSGYTGIIDATKVGAELIIAEISGMVFNDLDANGLYEQGDTPVDGHSVKLYRWNTITNQYTEALDENNQPISASTDAQGNYKFDYNQKIGYGKYALKFEDLDADHRYTVHSNADKENNSNVINTGSKTGWIEDIDATKLTSTHLSAGIITYDENDLAIKLNTNYDVKMRKSLTITPIITPTNFDSIKDTSEGYKWELVNASDAQYITLADANKKSLNVNPIKETPTNYEIGLKLTIKDMFGATTSETTKIKVFTNNSPVINAPALIELNVGDDWDPYDPNIVNGLGISDDHDKVKIEDMEVEEDVPVGEKFLWLFNTKNTGKLTTPGTYLVTYRYTDKDQNTTTAELKLKVHGLPYLEDEKGNSLDHDNMPAKYYRVGESSSPFEGVKGYWEKASDTIGKDPTKLEIDPDDWKTGSVSILKLKDNDGNIIQTITEAGKYSADIEVRTTQGGTIEFSRNIIARSDIKSSVNSIAIADDTTQFADLSEFLDKYGDKLKLTAKVNVSDETGNVSELQLTDYVLQEDIKTISFTRDDKTKPKTITLHVDVHDRSDKNYKDHIVTVPLTITIQDTTGLPPSIKFKNGVNPTIRVENDKVLRDAYGITTKKEYDEKADLAQPDHHRDPLTIYHKLMDDVIIEDQSGPNDNVGIQEQGIAKITQLDKADGEGGITNKTLIGSDEEARVNQDILLSLYTTAGHYEVTYYAIDNDKNEIESTRHIHTSGKTEFVKNTINKEPADTSINKRINNTNYQPSGVQAYHMNYDGTTTHESVVIDPSPINMKTPGMKQVEFTTSHHATNYGETQVKRPIDKFTQKIFVHGNIEFENVTNKAEDHFVDEEVMLNTATAYFMKAVEAQNQGDQDVVKTELIVSNSTNQDRLIVDEAGKHRVVYSTDDGLGLNDSKKTLTKEYRFYGLPELSVVKEQISIGEHTTKAQVSAMIDATGSVTNPDGGSETITIDNDYMNYASTGESIIVTGTYTLGNTTKTTTKEIMATKIAAPILEAKDITLNVGETLDLKTMSELKITHDYLSLDDVTTTGNIPSNHGIVTTPGTYQVIFQANDHEGNQANKSILVYVNGQPTLSGLDPLQTRVGMNLDIEKDVKATYEKAGVNAGDVPVKTTIDFNTNQDTLNISKYEMVDEEGNRSEVPSITGVGVYEVSYTATTNSKGTSTKKRVIIVHGNPTLEANSISIRKGESKTDFLSNFKKELNIKSQVIKTEFKDDKAVFTTIDLLKEDKVTIDLSNVKLDVDGNYQAVIKATADHDDPIVPKESKEKTIHIKVGEYQGEAPIVSTSDKKRQIDDPIKAEHDIKNYLLNENFLKIEVKDYEIKSTTIQSIEKETKTKTGTMIDIDDNEALKEMMTTIGIYKITYRIEDTAGNVVESIMSFEISGAISFGYKDNTDNIIRIDEVIETRQQTDGIYTGDELIAYQTGADGTLQSYPVQVIATDTSLDEVSLKEIILSYTPIETTYEDGTPRVAPTQKVKLLVQGNIQFLYEGDNQGEIQTYVGSIVNIDKTSKGILETIDEFGTITKNEIAVSLKEGVNTHQIGIVDAVLVAEDTISNAPFKTQSTTIKVHVNGIPEITSKEQIEVSKDASKSEMIEELQAQAWYINSRNEKIDMSGHLQYVESDNNTIKLSINYIDQGDTKVVEKTVKILIKETTGVNEKPVVGTGDDHNAVLYIGLSLLSSIGMLMMIILLARRKKGLIR